MDAATLQLSQKDEPSLVTTTTPTSQTVTAGQAAFDNTITSSKYYNLGNVYGSANQSNQTVVVNTSVLS
jgi:hypothetical protein